MYRCLWHVVFLCVGVSLAAQTTTSQHADIGDISDSFGDFHAFINSPTVLLFHGEITRGDILDFRRALRENEHVDTVLLSSGGGLLYEGMELASIIHDKGLRTHVPKGATCASACTFMFLAGEGRFAHQDSLGVHQFASVTVSEDVSETQYTTGEMIEHLNDFDTPGFVLEKMFITPPDDMYFFDTGEIAQINTSQADQLGALANLDVTAFLLNTPVTKTTEIVSQDYGVKVDEPSVVEDEDPIIDVASLGAETARFLQMALVLVGEYDGVIDGVWGDRSQGALVGFSNHAAPKVSDAVNLVFAVKDEITRGGWTYFVTEAGISFLLPIDAVARNQSPEFSSDEWSGFGGALTIRYSESSWGGVEDDHVAARNASSDLSEAYLVEREGRVVTSAPLSNGRWVYLRSDFVNGTWSTLAVISGPSAPNGMADAIAFSYDKTGYSFDVQSWLDELTDGN